jgi:hypothetical protein
LYAKALKDSLKGTPSDKLRVTLASRRPCPKGYTCGYGIPLCIWCVNDWCRRDELTPTAQKGRKRKLNWERLSRHIQEYPDALLRERAQYFGVHTSAIGYAKSRMGLTRKKRCDPAAVSAARERVMRRTDAPANPLGRS